MKEIEKLYTNGYTGIISYFDGFDDTLPPSKRYTLKIIKDNHTYKKCRGITYSHAKTEFNRWIKKNNLNNGVDYEK